MHDQNDANSLPSWLKEDSNQNVMGGTANTTQVVRTLAKTSSYGGSDGGGGGSSSVRSGSGASTVEEDYGSHDAASFVVTMDSTIPMGGIGGGGNNVDTSWAADPESQSQQTHPSGNRSGSNGKVVVSKKDYGSVMEMDQKKRKLHQRNREEEARAWHDAPKQDIPASDEDDNDEEEDDSSDSGSGSFSGSDESDSHDDSESNNDSDSHHEEKTRLLSSNLKKQSSSSQQEKKSWYNGGGSSSKGSFMKNNKNNTNQKRKKSKAKTTTRGKKRVPPRRNCCHSFFIVVQIAAILANLCMIAIEVVPMVFDLRAHKTPDAVKILDVALRCYFTFFSTCFLVTELEWIDSSLNNWITRGFLYTFLGVVAREQHLAMLANGTLVVKENSKEYWNGVWASLFVEISSWWIIGIGILYFLLGLFCMKAVRNRFREQYQSRLRDFYEEEE